MVSPPTPPLTENDAQQISTIRAASSLSASNSLGDAASTIYHEVFPTISNLAFEGHLPELIDLAETTELTVDAQSRVDQSRLLLVAPLVLSYIIVDDLPQAHIALTRLPDNLAPHPLTRSLLKLIAATRYREFPLIYKDIDELLALLQGSFFNAPLSVVIKLLLERYTIEFHRKTVERLSKAYTSLPIFLAAEYLNLPEAEARRSLEQVGWSFDSVANQVSPPPSRKSPHATLSASSLSTVRQIIVGTAQIESSA